MTDKNQSAKKVKKNLPNYLACMVMILTTLSARADRPPESLFEGIVYSFAENIKLPLGFEWLSGPGVVTRELYIWRDRGELEIIIVGEHRGEWLGFQARAKSDIESGKFNIDFIKINKPPGLESTDILDEWDQFAGNVLKSTKDLPILDGSPPMMFYERVNGKAELRFETKSYHIKAEGISRRFSLMMAKLGISGRSD